jgi:hypothetical protein
METFKRFQVTTPQSDITTEITQSADVDCSGEDVTCDVTQESNGGSPITYVSSSGKSSYGFYGV